MIYKLKFRTLFTLLCPLVTCSLFISCGQNSNQPKSELIKKVNAVHQQIMAQGNVSKEEEDVIRSLCSILSHDDGLAHYNPDNRMLLKDVDMAPVFNGCEALSKEETKTCFNNKISAFIKQEFDLNIAESLNLSEQKQVAIFFIIDEKGKLTGMKVRDAEVTIQAEILRVLRKIPTIQPAVYNGKNMAVLCSMLLKYGNELDIEVVYIPERPTND